jgi:hypothetical protein
MVVVKDVSFNSAVFIDGNLEIKGSTAFLDQCVFSSTIETPNNEPTWEARDNGLIKTTNGGGISSEGNVFVGGDLLCNGNIRCIGTGISIPDTTTSSTDDPGFLEKMNTSFLLEVYSTPTTRPQAELRSLVMPAPTVLQAGRLPQARKICLHHQVKIHDFGS